MTATGPPGDPDQTSGDQLFPDHGHPAPGQLGIKERRVWHTWQLVVIALVAAVIGMIIGHSGGSTSSAGPQTAHTLYSLPASSGTGTGTSATGGAAGQGQGGPSTTQITPAGTSTTLRASSSTTATTATTTTTTAGSSSTTAAGESTPPIVLLPRVQGQGPAATTTPAFTVSGGQWNVGWAYNCELAAAGTGSFQVFVVPGGGVPSASPAVNESGKSGSGVTPLTSVGSMQLQIKADAGCQWVYKVTGNGTPG